MRRLGSISAAVIAALAVASSGSGVAVAAARGHAACPRATGSPVVADRVAEVYEAPYRGSRAFVAVWGCAFSSGRPHELGPPHRTEAGYRRRRDSVEARIFIDHLALAGTDVGYEESRGGSDSASFEVFVVELRSGEVLNDVPTGSWYPPVKYSPPESFEHRTGVGPVTSLVVSADGSVAWIAEAAPRLGTYQVHALGPHAEEPQVSRAAAVGTSIDPASLAMAAGTIYWTQGGQPHAQVVR